MTTLMDAAPPAAPDALHAAEDGMFDFYTDYYRRAAASLAYGEFCTRVFGANYAQHGFADMAAVDRLIRAGELDATHRVLELGCGTGGIAAYVATTTGARVTGIDYIPEAVRQAQARAAASGRLRFEVADIGALPYPDAGFTTVVAIDTLYFTELDATLARIKRILTASGQLLAYYAQGANPQVPVERFDRGTLPPDCTDLGRALHRQGFAFETWDVTDADVRHARLKRAVLEELHPAFAAEGTLSLYENRLGEANGVLAAWEAGCHARYLYRAIPV